MQLTNLQQLISTHGISKKTASVLVVLSLLAISIQPTFGAGPSTDATLKSATVKGIPVPNLGTPGTPGSTGYSAGTVQVQDIIGTNTQLSSSFVPNDSGATVEVFYKPSGCMAESDFSGYSSYANESLFASGTASQCLNFGVSVVNYGPSNNFFMIQVTAADGTTKLLYKITVQRGSSAPSSVKAISAFTLPNQVGASSIDQTTHTVAITMPHGSSLTALPATFSVSTNAMLSVASTTQLSNNSTQDFSAPLTYVVTAQDGSTQSYVISVTVAAPLALPAFTLTHSSESATVGGGVTGFTVVSTGGQVATFTISPSIPNYMNFDAATGALTGSQVGQTLGTTIFTITGTNATGASSATFIYQVSAQLDFPTFTLSRSSEIVQVNTQALGFLATITGGAATSFAIDITPSGMSFNTSSGSLTGIPDTLSSPTTYTVTATNARGQASATFVLTVIAASPGGLADARSAAEAARRAAVITAKATIVGTVNAQKAPTLADYRAAEYAVNTQTTVDRINSQLLELQAKTPAIPLTEVQIAPIVKKESFVEFVSTEATQGSVQARQLVENAVVAADYKYKTSLLRVIKGTATTNLDSYAKIKALVDAEVARIQARKDRITALTKKLNG